VSKGSKRSLGWIPFKAAQLKRKGKSLRFSGKAFRVFERELLEGVTWKSGCFAQDAVGDWWLCLPVERQVLQSVAPKEAVGIDLGLKDIAAASDGEKLQAGHFYRNIEHKIALAQRRGHKRHAKRLHRTAARRRKEALHRFSRKIVNDYFMMSLSVEDADAWWQHIQREELAKKYPGIVCTPPKMQPWGIRVPYLSDPTGVLWHITDRRKP
jgi:putative transposase